MTQTPNNEKCRGEFCSEHPDRGERIETLEKDQVASSASIRTWKYVGGIAGTVALLFISFSSWLANETLGNLRADIKELKTSIAAQGLNEVRFTMLFEQMNGRVNTLEKALELHRTNAEKRREP